jgi:colanic acid/amylovoran biosynthesis protein
MRIGLAAAIRKAIPDCEVLLATPFPELDRHAYDGFPLIRCSRRRPGKVAALLLRSICWRLTQGLFRKDVPALLNDELQAYRSSDLIVDLSGDGLTEEYGARCIISHLVPIVLGKLLRKPVFVCAQTIGPLHKTRSICRWILSKADSISAREKITYNYLSGLGLNRQSLSLTADAAFLMEPASQERAREILAKEGVRLDKPLIGFSVSRLPGHIMGTTNSRKPVDMEMEMAESLDEVVRMGCRPIFISHVTGPGELRDDRRTAARIAQLAQQSSEIEVLTGDYSAQEIKSIIGLTDLFVGVRMHSCIAALSMSVPAISIAYGPKAHGIMDIAGQSSWLMNIKEVTADGLSSLIREAWQHRDSMRKSLQEEMPRVWALSEQNVEIIKRLLKVDGSSVS